MTPRTLIRTAALNALAAAAALSPADPDYQALIGAQVFLGQTWPSQSPPPGQPLLPNQLLIYCWDDDSETVAEKTTAPQFETLMTLVIEARFETTAPAAAAALPGAPSATAVLAAVDGALDALTFAVKKAICCGIQVAATALNGGAPVIAGIKNVKTTAKYALEGQRIAANGAVAVELQYGEVFEPLLANALTDLTILTDATVEARAVAGNVGNGTISGLTVGLGALVGAYSVAVLHSGTSASLTDPNGLYLGSRVIGLPVALGGLMFTVQQGTVPFAGGDGFTIGVAMASATQLDLSA